MSVPRRELLAQAAVTSADTYEHAPAIDHGAEHPAYLDALFENLASEVVERRCDLAMTASAGLG
jgi:hypothetical protein